MPTIAHFPQGKVTAIWGTAVLKTAHGHTRPLKVGDEVHRGDEILTSQDGIVQISPDGGDTVVLRHPSAPTETDLAIADLENGKNSPQAGILGGGTGSLTPGLRVERDHEDVTPLAFAYGDAQRTAEITVAAANIAPIHNTPAAAPLPPTAVAHDVTVTQGNNATVDLSGTDPNPHATITSIAVQHLPNPTTQGTLYLPDGVTPVTAGMAISPADAAHLIFHPVPSFSGTLDLPFTVTDSLGLVSSPATEHISLNSVTAPTGTPVDVSSSHNQQPIAFGLTGTDPTPGATIVSATITTLPNPTTQGTLYLPDGVTPVTAGTPIPASEASALIFKPVPSFVGTLNVPYTVLDSNNQTSAAVTEHVTVVDHPPVAVDDSYTTPENAALSANVASNDTTSVDGGNVFTIATQPAHGTVVFNSDGSFTYTPTNNYTGQDTFTYTLTDINGEASTAKATITIAAVNQPLTAVNEVASTPANTPVVVPVLASNVDPNGLPLHLVSVTPTDPTKDSVTVNPDGTIVVTPAAGVTGPVTLNYTVTDATGATASAQITVNVGPVAPPTAADITETTPENTPLVVHAADFGFADAANPGATLANVRIDTPPANGELLLNGQPVLAGQLVSVADINAGHLTFVPATNATGNNYDHFNFSVQDSLGNFDSTPNTYTLNVTPVNFPPTATPPHVNDPEGTQVQVPLTGTDPNPGGTITSVTVTKLPPAADGTLTLADGTPVTAGEVLTPAQAQGVVFHPTTGFTGDVPISYSVTDNSGLTSPVADAHVIVTPPNLVDQAPVAKPTDATGPENQPLTVSLAGTDTDGTIVQLNVTQLPSNGTLYLPDGHTPVTTGMNLSPAQAASLVFVPDHNFVGSPATVLQFTATDNDGKVSAFANENITITPVLAAPTAIPLPSSGTQGHPVTVDLSGTDPNPGGTITAVTVQHLPDPTTQGVLTLPDGTPVTVGTPISAADAAHLIFTPVASFSGTLDLPFTVTDNNGLVSTPATEPVTLTSVNAPVGTPVDVSSPHNQQPITVGLTGTDPTPGATIVSATVTTLPNPTTQGTLYLPDGVTPVTAGTPIPASEASALIFKPVPSFVGTLNVPYTVLDSNNQTSAAVTEHVTVVDHPPVAVDDSYTTPENAALSANVASNDTTSVDGGNVFTIATQPAHGTVVFNSDGSFIYTPTNNYTGQDTFTYTLTDINGEASTAKATITIAAVHLPLTAVDELASTPASTPVVVPVLAPNVDPNGLPLTVTNVTVENSALGNVSSPNSDGSVTFTPKPGITGPVVLDYTITDSTGATASAHITVNVGPVAPPTAANVTETTPENTPLVVHAADLGFSDAANPGATLANVRIDTPPTNGELLLNGQAVLAGQIIPVADINAGQLTFVPATNATGNNYDHFNFSVQDSLGNFDSTPNTYTLNVTPVLMAPTATPPHVNDPEGTPVTVPLTGTDPNPGGTITAVTVTKLPPAADGTLTLADGSTPVTAGEVLTPAQAAGLIFHPSAGFTGDVPVSYTVTDSSGLTSPFADAHVIVTPPNLVDDAPVAKPTPATGPENQPLTVSLAGTDADGTVVQLNVTQLPSNGTLYLPDGHTPVTANMNLSPAEAASLVFVPDHNFIGNPTTQLQFTATDNDGKVSTPATEIIQITPVLAAPIAIPSATSGTQGHPVTVDLSGTDPNPGGTITTVTVQHLPDPTTQGVLTLPDGTPVTVGTPISAADAAHLTFTPVPSFSGTLDLPFTVTDNNNLVSAPATDLISLSSVGAPVGVPTPASGTENQPVAVKLSATDADGTITSYNVTQLPSNGTLYLADGHTPVTTSMSLTPAAAASLVFVPATNFFGAVTTQLQFTATDSNQQVSAPVSESINILGLPTAVPHDASGTQGHPVTVDLSGTDPNPGGTITSVTITTLPNPTTQGTLTLPDGTPVVAGTPISPADAAHLTFTPVPSFSGTLDLPFTVTDNNGLVSSPATEPVTLGAVTPPVGVPTPASGTENQPVAVKLSATDTDGTISFYTVTQLPSNGTLYLADGHTPVTTSMSLAPDAAASLVFVPATNFIGQVTTQLQFTATDSNQQVSNPVSEPINILGLPTAVPHDASGTQGHPVTVDLSGTDPNPGGTITSVTITTLPNPTTQGTLTLPDGTPVVAGTPISPADAAHLTFTPVPSFSGTLDLPFTVTDNNGLVSSPATEPVTLGAVTPPVGVPTPVSGTENQPVAVKLSATDADGTITSYNVTQLPSNGTLYLADGHTPVTTSMSLAPDAAASLVFVPATNFIGQVTTQLQFTATDSNQQVSNPVSEPINILGLPTAVPHDASGTQGHPVTVDLSGTDPNPGGTITSVTITTLPNPTTQGTLTLPDGTPVVAGTPISPADAAHLTFTPVPSFSGTLDLPFTVTDNNGLVSSPATEPVTLGAVTPPVGVPTPVSGTENQPVAVKLSATDADGTITSYNVTQLPSNGTLYLADGHTPVTTSMSLAPDAAASLVFVPATNFIGQVTTQLQFTATDSNQQVSNPVSEPINILGLPTAVPHDASGTQGHPVTVDLSGTDPNPGGTITSVTITTLPNPTTQGTLTLPDGTPVVAGTPISPADAAHLTFTPVPSFSGTLDLPFTVTDNNGLVSSPATEPVTLGAVTPPVGVPTPASGTENQPVTVKLSATDTDGTISFYTVTQLPSNGTLYLADGHTPVTTSMSLAPDAAASLVFVPATNFIGQVTTQLQFTATDSNQQVSNPVSEPINILGLPTAVPHDASGTQGHPVTVDLSGTDPNPGGTITSVTITTLPNPTTQGTLTLPDGTPVVAGTPISPADAAHLTFTPVPSFSGTLDLPFTVTDNNGLVSSPATEPVTLGAVTPPVGVPTPVSGTENQPVAVKLSATDADGTITSYNVTQLPSNGTLYLADGHTPVTTSMSLAPDAAASLVFVPATNFFGAVTTQLQFTATDSNQQVSAPVSEPITISPVDHAPVNTVPGAQTALENTPLSITGISVNDPDIAIANVPSNFQLASVELKVAHGILDTTAVTGLTASGEGTGDLVLSGTQAQIDAALATLVYQANTKYVGSDTLSMTSTDGVGETALSTVAINVQHQAPVFGGGGGSCDVSEKGLPGGNPEPANAPAGFTATATASGQIAVTDTDSYTLSLNAPTATYTSNGTTIVWSGAGTHTLVGTANGETIATLSITDTGAYNFQLSGIIDNARPASSILPIQFGVTATDPYTSSVGHLTVNVQDDAPVVAASQSITAPSIATNLLFVLDVSGSMSTTDGVNGTTRLASAIQSIETLIHDYSQSGPVMVQLVTFSSTAQDMSTQWVSAATAEQELTGLTAGGDTNYYAALTSAAAAYATAGKLTDAQTVSYFMSDGQPNVGTPTSVSTPAGWQSFVSTNHIDSYAIGYGEAVATYLDEISYNGQSGSAQNAVLLTNFDQLTPTLGATAPQLVTGNLITGGASGTQPTYGAEGEHAMSLTVNGVTYTYEVSSNEVSTSGGTANYTFNASTHLLDITLADTAQFSVNTLTGDYTYTNPTTVPTTGSIADTINFSVTDNDLNTVSSSITLTAQHYDVVQGTAANQTLTAPSNNPAYIIGYGGGDHLIGGTGADILDPGTGNNTLTGGGGADVFAWHLGDQGTVGKPAVDTITDFSTANKSAGGDALDLRDLLQGENTTGGVGNLDDYLHFQTTTSGSTTSTVVHVSSAGGFTNGVYNSAAEDQTIVLQGVNLTSAFNLAANATDNQIIQELLNRGKLVVDHG